MWWQGVKATNKTFMKNVVMKAVSSYSVSQARIVVLKASTNNMTCAPKTRRQRRRQKSSQRTGDAAEVRWMPDRKSIGILSILTEFVYLASPPCQLCFTCTAYIHQTRYSRDPIEPGQADELMLPALHDMCLTRDYFMSSAYHFLQNLCILPCHLVRWYDNALSLKHIMKYDTTFIDLLDGPMPQVYAMILLEAAD